MGGFVGCFWLGSCLYQAGAVGLAFGHLHLSPCLQVNLADFYEGVPPGTPHYALHSMVCYYGAHYSAFVWAADCRAWLLFDDVRVSRVGSWTDVRRKCEAGRIQPSVLFYEAVA